MADNIELPQVYTGEGLAFLKTFTAQQEGYLQVVAVESTQPEGDEPRIERQTVALDDIDNLNLFIEQHQGWNFLFVPNLSKNPIAGVATKADIAAATCFHVTLTPKDPPTDATLKEKYEHLTRERARLHQQIGACPLFPTFIIDTDYGYQCVWEAVAPVSVDVAETINQSLCAYFRAPDMGWGVHQPLCLPHSIYHPGFAEQRKGQEEVPIQLLAENSNAYAPADFDVLSAGPRLDLGSVDLAALSARLSTPTAQMDRDLRRLMDGKPTLWMTDQTLEGFDAGLALTLHRLGCTPDETGHCVSNYTHGKQERDVAYLNDVVRKACAPKKTGLPDANKPLCEKMSAFMADRKPQEVLMEGILYKGDHNAAMGHPNAGKTAGMLDIALHVTFGMKHGERDVARSRVLYLAGEDPDGIRRRVKLWCQTHRKKYEDLDGWFFIVKRPVLDDMQQVAKLLLEMEVIRPELVIVDTFSANYGGESEDKATEVKKWMKMVREDIVGRFNCCVVTLHHPPKGAVDIHNFRGSGVAAGDLDNVFCFRNLGEDHIRMDQADGKAKHRTAKFDQIIWQTETAIVDGWFNSLNKPETSVRVTLANNYKVGSAIRVCRAIQVLSENNGKPSHAAIAELAGVATGSIASLLTKMKTKGGLADYPNKTLVTLKDERLCLTKTGKDLAGFAMVDRDMTRRIEALKGASTSDDGGDDDT